MTPTHSKTESLSFILKCIDSCRTIKQCQMCRQLIINFYKLYNDRTWHLYLNKRLDLKFLKI